ncbi:MAG TPA: hypothetical protein P5186_01995 [Candidatus Paceibacterota bacterium]|nr:hypothetical protein [Verrucomicrobiota bacterium]HRY46795.1 hypothetical protein [Candidatus Paceibacterota bacterium]
MKKKLLLAVLLAVMTPLLWLGSGGSPSWADHSQAMGQKVAGGWLATLKMGDTLIAEILFNLNADGCVIVNGQLLGDTEGKVVGMNTTAHGTWKRTGPDEIEAFILLFEQDTKGKTFLYETGRSCLTLMERGTKLLGTMDIQLIKATADPLNPDSEAGDIVYETTFDLAARPLR